MENNVFWTLKPHKHIALHQIHKVMLFFATSYDPFKLKMAFFVSCIFQMYSNKIKIFIYIIEKNHAKFNGRNVYVYINLCVCVFCLNVCVLVSCWLSSMSISLKETTVAGQTSLTRLLKGFIHKILLQTAVNLHLIPSLPLHSLLSQKHSSDSLKTACISTECT